MLWSFFWIIITLILKRNWQLLKWLPKVAFIKIYGSFHFLFKVDTFTFTFFLLLKSLPPKVWWISPAYVKNFSVKLLSNILHSSHKYQYRLSVSLFAKLFMTFKCCWYCVVYCMVLSCIEQIEMILVVGVLEETCTQHTFRT